jgi:hypothetical protein
MTANIFQPLSFELAGRVGEYFAQVPRGVLKVSLHEHNYTILSGDIVIAPTVRPLAVAIGGSAGLMHFSGGGLRDSLAGHRENEGSCQASGAGCEERVHFRWAEPIRGT